MKGERGFTLIEVIIILVLIGIVSVVAVGRIMGSNTFNGIVVRDEIVSAARNARQNAMGRSTVNLTIQPSAGGDSLTISASEVGGGISSITTDLDGVTLNGDINITDSCATTNGVDSISNAAPLILNYQELGDLTTGGVTGSTGAITSAVRVCINNDPTLSVCISPSGFAYAGNCDV